MLSSTEPPWAANDLPLGLTPAHLNAAARVIATCLLEDLANGDRIEPVLGEAMAYFRLSGTHYEHSRQRITQLLAAAPIAHDVERRPFYPAILVTDPTVTPDGLHPLAVVASTGYVGSIWNPNGLAGAPKVERGVRLRRFLASRICVEQHEYGYEVRAWVWAGSAAGSAGGR